VRLFFALPLVDAVRNDIARTLEGCRKTLPGLRWLEPRTLHVTLLFIGECNGEESDRLINSLSSLEPLPGAFGISWKGMESFPGRGPGRVFYLPVIEGAGKVSEIRRQLVHAAEVDNGGVRRRYRPHITVARARRGARPVGAERLGGPCRTVAGSAVIDRLVLFRSRLERNGAQYEELFSLSLGRNDDLEKR
jgi:2'-5' RNA ligase